MMQLVLSFWNSKRTKNLRQKNELCAPGDTERIGTPEKLGLSRNGTCLLWSVYHINSVDA